MSEISPTYTNLKKIKEAGSPEEALLMSFRDNRLAVFLGDSVLKPNILVTAYGGVNALQSFSIARDGQLMGEVSCGDMPFNHGEYDALVDHLLKSKFSRTNISRKDLRQLFNMPESEAEKIKVGFIDINAGYINRKVSEDKYQAAVRFSNRIREIGLEAGIVPGNIRIYLTGNDVDSVVSVFREFDLPPKAVENHDRRVGFKLFRGIKETLNS